MSRESTALPAVSAWRELSRQGSGYLQRGSRELWMIAREAAGAEALAGLGRPPQRAVVRYERLVRHAQLARESLLTYRRLAGLEPLPLALDTLEACVLFIGQSRSGHSLVAALLDAHPEVVLAHELHAARHLLHGADFGEVATAMACNARAFHRQGRGYSGYDYAVPGQYQGRVTRLRVIGDKKANGTARLLRRHPDLLHRLQARMPVPLRLLYVVRNPWDNIASKALRTGTSLSWAARSYLRQARAIARLQAAHPDGVHELHLDRLSDAPREVLRALLASLGLAPTPGYLDACAERVFSRPRRTAQALAWPAPLMQAIGAELRTLPALQAYADAR